MTTPAASVARVRIGWTERLGISLRLRPSRDTNRPIPWIAAVQAIVTDLESLNRSTEEDFLAVGGKLMGLQELVGRVSSDIASLVELITGEHGERAEKTLSRTWEISKAMEQRAAAGDHPLRVLQDSATRIHRTFSEFREIVTTFRAVGILTRVETARLGNLGTDFANLADEVKKLAESVGKKVQTTLEESKKLDEQIAHTLSNVAHLEQNQLAALPPLIQRVMAGLDAFRERQRQARDLSVHLESRNKAIANAIGNLITSLQSHDITRQQIEHVIEALNQVQTEYGDAGRNGTAPTAAAAAVLTLQSSQLLKADQVFTNSVQQIRQGLDVIAHRAGDLADESQGLLGISATDRESFFLEMERCLTAILAAISNCSSNEAAARTTTGEIESTACQMALALEQIQDTEIQIQRLALNTSIRSAHIGQAGDALAVLAGSMHTLGANSIHRSECVAEAIVAMKGATAQLAGRDANTGLHEDDQQAVLAQIRTTIEDIHSASESSFARVHQIVDESSGLREDVDATQSGFAVGQRFQEVIGRSRSRLQATAAQASRTAGEYSATGQLDALASRYTMQTERDVHQALAGNANVLVLREDMQQPGSSSNVSDLGENVELF